MKSVFKNRKICICREISKKFEEVYRGKIEEVINAIQIPKGEFVIVIDGNDETMEFTDLTIVEHVNIYIKEGYSIMESIKKVASDRNLPKNVIYSQYHSKK